MATDEPTSPETPPPLPDATAHLRVDEAEAFRRQRKFASDQNGVYV
jgi:hypothetical protein